MTIRVPSLARRLLHAAHDAVGAGGRRNLDGVGLGFDQFGDAGEVERAFSKTWSGLRGTEGSNPSPSSAESANHRFLSSRQAIMCGRHLPAIAGPPRSGGHRYLASQGAR